MGELIAVLSGKGGTGKTSLCAGIATALAEDGAKVLCIDCDIGLRNLDISLGMADSGALSFFDLCQGGYDLEQATAHRIWSNLSFLTAPLNCHPEDVNEIAFRDLLRRARGNFDYVFLDAPAGVDAGFRLCARNADRIILVTNPDPSAIRDAARTGQVLETMGKEQVKLVVNKVTAKLFEITRRTVDDVMDEAGLPLLGIVPEDENVVLCASFDRPLLYKNRKGAAAACRRIAQRIQGLPVPMKIR